MNIFFRILLAVYAFCLTIVSVITMMITFRTDIFDRISSYLIYDVLPYPTPRLTMFLITLIFFALSLMFLFSGFKSDKDKKSVSKHTNIGEVKISLNTLENIALAASRKLNGVRETKAIVTKHEESVSIVIKAIVFPDINIPALSEDIQVRVKSSVEESSGIKVLDVKVLVENIYTGSYKSRVE